MSQPISVQDIAHVEDKIFFPREPAKFATCGYLGYSGYSSCWCIKNDKT